MKMPDKYKIDFLKNKGRSEPVYIVPSDDRKSMK